MMILSVIAFMAFADSFSVSPQLQSQMLKEADDWIDDMPVGLHDRLSDAIYHSLQGFNGEVEGLRQLKDTTGLSDYQVIVENVKGDIPMRLYKSDISTPETSPLPLLIYFHGGGWSLGSIEMSDRFCRALVSKGGVRVLSVDYPLAPEHPYPAAVDFCEKAIDFVTKNAVNYGSSPELVSIGGDGAGGNLALSAFIKNPEKFKSLRSIVLFYPLLEVTQPLDKDSKRKFGRGHGLDSRLWEAFVAGYLNKADTDGADFILDPLTSPDNIWENLPPVLLISAGRDIIIDREIELSKKTQAINYVNFEGAIHGFITDNHQPSAFNKAVEITSAFLRQ